MNAPPTISPPFTDLQLIAAIMATHQEDWVWDIQGLREPVTMELLSYLREAEGIFRVNLIGNPNARKTRILLECVGAVMTAGIEIGYRLAGGDPTSGPSVAPSRV